MSFRAVLFDVGGPIDMECAWEIAVDGAIASACGLEGIRVDQAAIEEASERAVEAFADDTYGHMIETLCGGEPATVARVRRRVDAMTRELDAFQLRPGIGDALRRLRQRGLVLQAVGGRWEALERVGIADLFDRTVDFPPSDCVMVGDRLDRDVAPVRAQGMACIRFRTGRWRRQRPRCPEETPDADVSDVPELEEAILRLQGH